MRACVRACVRTRARACVCVCVMFFCLCVVVVVVVLGGGSVRWEGGDWGREKVLGVLMLVLTAASAAFCVVSLLNHGAARLPTDMIHKFVLRFSAYHHDTNRSSRLPA